MDTTASNLVQVLKNGLAIDRLSSHRFLANAFTMQYHLLAYALVVPICEAGAEGPEVATAEVATLRSQLFKNRSTVARREQEIVPSQSHSGH